LLMRMRGIVRTVERKIMKRLALFSACLMSVTLALGQGQTSAPPPYQPAVPPPSMGGYGGGMGFGWGGGGVGSTVQGSALTGMSNVISAKGSYNLSTSAAAVNMTQAQKNEIENHQQYTNTYFDMRATNKAARAAEEGPRVTAEQVARMAQEAAPKPLSPGEVNDVTGKLNWPEALQMDMFAADRKKLEDLFVSYSQMGSMNYADQSKARTIINDMNKLLKTQVKSIPGSVYVTCKKFLEGLMFTAAKCHLG
jgi:hypothetical protein